MAEELRLAHCRPGRRLLVLLPFAPRLDAAHGGGRVTAQLLSHLVRRHRIALLYLRAEDEPGVEDGLRERCSLVEEVARPAIDFSLAQRCARFTSLLRSQPLWAAASYVKNYAEKAREIVRNWKPDIVQLEYHVMGQYASALRSRLTPMILVEHEPGAQAARDLWPHAPSGFGRIGPYLELRAWERYEREIVRRVQAVVVFTERDRQAVTRLAEETPIYCIPLGTPLPKEPLNPLGDREPNLVFVGNFIHPPNVDAALRLASSIFPAVRTRFPETTLYVVGDQPTPEMQRAATERVIITGRVSDVTPYLDRATVMVVPLRLGGGMRVKVLEALAAGKAIVASSRAVEGLGVVDGEHVLLAESDEQFSAAILELLNAPEQRLSLAKNARDWACTHLSWQKSVEAYETLYGELLASSQN